jgi:hypothetical protein
MTFYIGTKIVTKRSKQLNLEKREQRIRSMCSKFNKSKFFVQGHCNGGAVFCVFNGTRIKYHKKGDN